MRNVDKDLDPAAPTIFELVDSSLAALNVIGRGLPSDRRIGRSLGFIARTGRTHFSGRVSGWLAIDEEIASEVRDAIAEHHPDYVFAALTGIDKTSHSEGHEGAYVDRALKIVDDTVAKLRADAEARGVWDQTHIWVVSDHGHSPVLSHDDIADLIRRIGFRTIAHPFVFSNRGEVAVMVSGNAMAHIYLDLDRTIRPYMDELDPRFQPIKTALLARDSVDLMIVPTAPGGCEIHNRERGMARLGWSNGRISYTPATGDPLGIGQQRDLTDTEAYDVTLASDYPDSLVQIARLADSPRSGEIILSASRNWDFRGKYEPIPHESSHGALHREHMLVPILMSRPPRSVPRRTVDVMPSTLKALGLPIPSGLDGSSFL
jgi:arylsulfatase A-like enzyme